MQYFTDDIIRDLLSKSLETATVDADGWHDVGQGPSSDGAKFVSFLTIQRLSWQHIRRHPLVPATIPVCGYIYNVKSSQLIEVPDATAAERVAA